VECPESVHLAACLQRFFAADGCRFVGSGDAADVVVLNACERIASTPEVVRGYLEQARREPSRVVLVVGCVPREAAPPDAPPNFHVVPFHRLVRQPGLIGPAQGFSRSFELLPRDDVFHGHFPLEENLPGDPPVEEVALLTIGSGCEGRCTFCTIRRGRGAFQSFPLEQLVEEARVVAGQGRHRLVLVADDAGCWGVDLGLDLADLLGALVEAVPGARLMLRTMNPVHLPALHRRLLPYVPRLDYLYLPMQSGSDRVLRLMNRGYRAAEVLGIMQEMRQANPRLFLKSDFIAGFPGETRADFRDSCVAARAFDQAAFHRFLAYPGTPAASLAGALDLEELEVRMEVARRLGFHTVDPAKFDYGPEVAPP
jgi:tRNA A37 methylthiotransferase MiaB